MSNGHYVIPKLVQDNTLKSLITTVNGEDALKVKEVAQGEVDLDPVTEALGDPSDPTYSSGDGTVISLLKGIYSGFNPPTPAPTVSHIAAPGGTVSNWQLTSSNTPVTLPSSTALLWFENSSAPPTFRLMYQVNDSSSERHLYVSKNNYYALVPYTGINLFIRLSDQNNIVIFQMVPELGNALSSPLYIVARLPYNISSIIN